MGLSGLLVATAISVGTSSSTLASWSDRQYERSSFTADTLPVLTPSITPSSTSADVSWGSYSRTSLSSSYTLSHANNSSGTGASTAYAGSGHSVTDTGGLVSSAQVAATASQISAGLAFTCAVEAGSVYCWGANGSAQVTGSSTSTTENSPVKVGLSGTVTAVSAGSTHACAIVNAQAYCWGSSGSGQLGGSSTSTPVGGLLAGKSVTAISAGLNFTCAIANSAAYCWGAGSNGQLGNSTTSSSSTPVAVQLPAGTVSSIAAGSGSSACAVVGGAAYCWGLNTNGQVGDNSTTLRTAPVAVNVTAGDAAMDGKRVGMVSVGDAHSCALTETGVFCWGLGTSGQLGNSASSSFSYPRPVTGSSAWNATAISTAGGHTCAIRSTGAIVCWGLGSSGQLGNGASANSNTAVTVTASGVLSGVTPRGISAGGVHSCTVGTNGSVYCWGTDASRQLGNGTGGGSSNSAVASNTPTVTGCANGASLLAGPACSLAPSTTYWWRLVHTYGPWTSQPSAWTAATTTARSATTPSASSTTRYTTTTNWSAFTPASQQTGRYVLQRATDTGGSNLATVADSASLSATDTGQIAATTGIPAMTSISTGYGTTCGIGAGDAFCWGYNAYGQLGDGSTTMRYLPERIEALRDKTVTKIAVGGDTSALSTVCAIADGAAYCWGYGTQGQIGDNADTSRSVPTAVQGISGTVTDIDVGDGHVCAVAGGRVYCWGDNIWGQLGQGNTTDLSVATLVPGLTSVTAVSTGYDNTCVINSGTVYCWGHGTYGQLGNGADGDSKSPTTAVGSAGGSMPGGAVKAITSGADFTCAIASDDNPYCWGHNVGGTYRLGGNGSGHHYNTPQTVVRTNMPSGATTDIAAGNGGGCLIAGGKPYCWGQGLLGRNGDNSTADNPIPALVSTSPTAGALPSTATSVSISAGYGTRCVVADGASYCWGYGGSGAIGDGSIGDRNVPFKSTIPSLMHCPNGGRGLGTAYCSLALGTTYYYRVQYYIGSWAGPTSAWVPVTTAS